MRTRLSPRSITRAALATFILAAACEQSGHVVAPSDAAAPGYKSTQYTVAEPLPMPSFSVVPGTVTNGSFEINGGVNASSFSNWTLVNSGSGSIFVVTGTTVQGIPFFAPTDGQFAAATWQGGPGSHILYQDVTLPSGDVKVEFDIAIHDFAGAFFTPASLSQNTFPNEQARVDLINPSAAITDVGAGVLANLYQTHAGDPTVMAYKHVSAVVHGLGGQTVRLRLAEADNQSNFIMGVDHITISSLDNTPPVITPAIAGTLGDNGWYTSDVGVTWTATDAESAITSAPCAAGSLTTDSPATTFTCSATSAGGTASASVTVKRDATAPTIAFTGNAGTYAVDQNVSISCGATDNLSGISSSTCPGATGAAYTFALGGNTLNASAKDNAGNTSAASATFTVKVTEASLCTLTQRFVTKAGIGTSLCAKLSAAAASGAAGDMNARAGQLNAYANELQAQTGKAVSAANAAILLQLVSAL